MANTRRTYNWYGERSTSPDYPGCDLYEAVDIVSAELTQRICLGSNILTYTESGEPYLGRVIAIYHKERGGAHLRIQWYYRSHELPFAKPDMKVCAGTT